MQMIGRTAFAPEEVADLADDLALPHQAAAHHSVRIELLRKHMQVTEPDALVGPVGHDEKGLLALRAQHRSVAHGNHVMQIGLASVCPFDALLTGRGTDILALVAETSRALADIEVAGLAKVTPPGIGIVVGGGFIQNQLLAVDATAIGPHAVAYEGVPRVSFQKHAADAGELIETMYRPSDHASGLVDFVQEGRAADVDVDRIGKAYL